MTRIHEAARTTDLRDHADVLVCGGGPAGVAAAVAAARVGASTQLIELHGCLGGVWTAGLLSWILDAENKAGLVAEIIDRLAAAGGKARGHRDGVYDAEAMKLILEEMLHEAGVRVRLYSRVVAAVTERRHLAAAITESPSGREAWSAAAYVDATGNGDLGAVAGCGFDLGRPGDGKTQPMSLMALLSGPADAIEPFALRDGMPGREQADAKTLLLEHLRRGGVEPSYGRPTLFTVRDGLYALMANHAYGRSGLDADDLTAATLATRREVHQVIDALRRSGPPLDRCRLVATAAQIGIREGRRLHGRATVTVDDAIAGRRHDDSACRVTFGVDVHSVDPRHGTGYDNQQAHTQPYDIPRDALRSRDLDNLFMAGRCISGDFLAHASYRVTGNAVALGQTAGQLAADHAAARTHPTAMEPASI